MRAIVNYCDRCQRQIRLVRRRWKCDCAGRVWKEMPPRLAVVDGPRAGDEAEQRMIEEDS